MSTPSKNTSAKRRAPVVEILGLLVFPIMTLTYAAGFLHSIWDLDPRSSTYPRIVISLLVPITLWAVAAEIVRWLRTRAASPDHAADGRSWARLLGLSRQWRRTAAAILTVAGFIYTTPLLGFYVTAAIYLFITMILLGVRNIVALVVLTAGGITVSYLFFSLLLGLVLPRGLVM